MTRIIPLLVLVLMISAVQAEPLWFEQASYTKQIHALELRGQTSREATLARIEAVPMLEELPPYLLPDHDYWGLPFPGPRSQASRLDTLAAQHQWGAHPPYSVARRELARLTENVPADMRRGRIDYADVVKNVVRPREILSDAPAFALHGDDDPAPLMKQRKPTAVENLETQLRQSIQQWDDLAVELYQCGSLEEADRAQRLAHGLRLELRNIRPRPVVSAVRLGGR